jgi:hypothetical protein
VAPDPTGDVRDAVLGISRIKYWLFNMLQIVAYFSLQFNNPGADMTTIEGVMTK